MKTRTKVLLGVVGAIVAIAIAQTVIDSLTPTVPVADFERGDNYRGYSLSGLKDFQYGNPPAYEMRSFIDQSDMTWGGTKIRVEIRRDGIARYLYKKGLKRVFVEKRERIMYPLGVFKTSSMQSASSPSDIPVSIVFGQSKEQAKITLESQKSDDGLYRYQTYLAISDNTMKKIHKARSDIEVIIDDTKAGDIRYEDFALVNETNQYDADSYETTFTMDNLDKALRYYRKTNDQERIKVINGLYDLSRSFKKFHWSDGQVTENPDGKHGQGFVLEYLKILYWSSDDTLVYGTTETKGGTESELKAYKKYSFLLPDVRVSMNQKGEKYDVVAGLVTVDQEDVDPTASSIDHWIVSYTGRKSLVVEGKTVYLPAFKLVRVLK